MLPLPYSGANDWANTGVAAMVRKTTVVRSFFMSSFSLLTFLEAHHRVPSFVHRVSYEVNGWFDGPSFNTKAVQSFRGCM
jgi:hypothetical protein